jgi:hypothetical protein
MGSNPPALTELANIAAAIEATKLAKWARFRFF